jgi:hypothetical protein
LPSLINLFLLFSSFEDKKAHNAKISEQHEKPSEKPSAFDSLLVDGI